MSCWEPIDSTEASEPAPLTWQPVALEAEILAVLEGAPAPGELIAVAFHRKEQQLAALFASLPPADSLALQRRLALALAGDPIAERFARLVATRRARLVEVLVRSRRRHPLQVARMHARPLARPLAR